MAEESAGKISYTVDVETAKLLDGSNALNKSLDGLQDEFDKTDKSAEGLNKTSGKLSTQQSKLSTAIKKANGSISKQSEDMEKLKRIVAGYLTLKLLKNAMALADQYTDNASRIKNVTESTREYEMVQARLLETANGTYRSLSEAQEVYLSTAETLKDLGYNTAQVLDITDSMSYAFVRDAARADQATNAMDAYSKSLMQGKIDADAWASILAATPSIVQGVAEATGETANRIRELGATGKLSTEALNEGFRRSLETNKQLAADMDATGRDAFVALQNSLQVFIGKVNESSGATAGLVEAVGTVSKILQDPETIEAAKTLATGIVTAFGAIIEGGKDVVKFTQWLSEEVAAALGGISTDDIVRLEQRLFHLQDQVNRGFMDKDISLMFTSDEDVQKEIESLQTKIAAYYKSQEESAKSASDKTKESTESIKENTDAVEQNVSATNKKIESDKAAKAEQDKRNAGLEENERLLQDLRDQLSLAGLAGEELAQAQAKLSLNSYATPKQIEEVRRLTQALYERNQAESNQKLAEQLDPAMGAESAYNKDLEDLQKLNEAKIIEDQRYLELKTQLENEHSENMRRIEEERFAAQSRSNQLLIDSLNEVQAAGTTALTGLLTGTNNLTDAMQQLGAGILHHAVGALVEMGIQYVKNSLMEKVAAAQSAATAAATGASIAASYAPAAATASVATMGGAATIGFSAMSAAIPAMIALATRGGRLNGGPVSPGGAYRINEDGRPEIFQNASGQQFMLPNSRGEVISNKDAVGGGGNVYNIAINVDSAGGTTVSESGGNAEDSKALAFAIKAAVLVEIEKQTRQGGMIRNFVKNGSV